MASTSGKQKPPDIKNSDYDPELDFFSDQFNPVKALNTPGLKPPVENAGAYDNLNKYESEMYGKQTRAQTTRVASPPNEEFQRKFQLHQMPIRRERRELGNVLTKMADMKGPLASLKKCVEERIRVKVYTRNCNEVRGHCLAYVAAFDKHWNLALEDVTEIWTRRRRKKVPPLAQLEIQERSIKKKKVQPPPIQVTRINKKREKCERHVPQLLVRGEEIVIITFDATTTRSDTIASSSKSTD